MWQRSACATPLDYNTDGAVETSVVSDSNTAPTDSATLTDTGPPDEGNTSADYGAPPPRDAGGPDDNGGGAAEYGAPPPDAAVAPPYGIALMPDGGCGPDGR